MKKAAVPAYSPEQVRNFSTDAMLFVFLHLLKMDAKMATRVRPGACFKTSSVQPVAKRCRGSSGARRYERLHTSATRFRHFGVLLPLKTVAIASG